MCVSVYTRRKSLCYSLPRRRAASPRILIQHASPEDDRYPSVEPASESLTCAFNPHTAMISDSTEVLECLS